MPKLPTLLVALALTVPAFAACGDDESDSTTPAATPVNTDTPATATDTPTGSGGELTVTADPGGQLKWVETELAASAGETTIKLVNGSSVPHDVDIESEGGEEVAGTDVVTDGEAETTATLEAGTYVFYCSVAGHRAAGMEGKLTVE